MDVEEGKLEEELTDKPGTRTRTKFSVLHCIRIPFFNEMWCLTVDPFTRISVFIAKLSERQYCWRVFEDFHSQEYIQFFDIHCSLFMRLHFSIGGYDYRRDCKISSRYAFQHHSSPFLQIICIDTPESTSTSRSPSLRVDGVGKPIFRW